MEKNKTAESRLFLVLGSLFFLGVSLYFYEVILLCSTFGALALIGFVALYFFDCVYHPNLWKIDGANPEMGHINGLFFYIIFLPLIILPLACDGLLNLVRALIGHPVFPPQD